MANSESGYAKKAANLKDLIIRLKTFEMIIILLNPNSQRKP